MTRQRIKTIHRASSLLLALFVVLHLFNHLALAAGSDVHLLVMSGLRTLYRGWIGETVLLASVLAQMITGLTLARPHFSTMIQRGNWQVLSGLYLSMFMAIHICAIMWARLALGLDTNLWFGAAGFHVWPWMLFFIPYYGLAIIAFATHAGFALQRVFGIPVAGSVAVFGAVVAAAIITLMSGGLHTLNIPETYLASYR
jgi:hypothetical protein